MLGQACNFFLAFMHVLTLTLTFFFLTHVTLHIAPHLLNCLHKKTIRSLLMMPSHIFALYVPVRLVARDVDGSLPPAAEEGARPTPSAVRLSASVNAVVEFFTWIVQRSNLTWDLV